MMHETILWIDKCKKEDLVSNTLMLCTKNIFLLNNMRDITPEEYNQIIQSSGNAKIIRK